MKENATMYTMLENLSLPKDISTLSLAEKEILATEVRSRIIEVTSHNGGHLASSLGTVELTIAVLASLKSDMDRVVWDVGHQAYPWKILTGRHKEFSTLRTYKGTSGFLRKEESPFDYFGAGHASTSISASLGMAIAHEYQGNTSSVFAVIGDGALTGGQALEALNQAGLSNSKLIIILNDNTFSISGNVGALSRFISRSFSTPPLRHIKEGIKWSMSSFGSDTKFIDYLRKGERSLKALMTPGMLFEALQLNYIGPIDGHDIASLEKHIALAQEQGKSVVLHVSTEKGKGFIPAEKDPIRFHGVSQFSIEDGEVHFTASPSLVPTYTSIFTKTLCALARSDSRIFTITAAMPEGTGTNIFQQEFPERFIDVGICEQHAVTLAGGLAIEGLRPFVAIYSTFLQRAYDQILHDICVQNLPVVFCIDRAGFVGEDGATHHGVFDIAYLRHIPNISILAPSDENELQHALYTALHYNAPIAIRYPKGTAIGVKIDSTVITFEKGVGRLLQEGTDILIIAIGSLVYSIAEILPLLEKKYSVRCTLFDARWVKPLAKEQICTLVKKHDTCLLFEEGTQCGGFTSAVCELLIDEQCIPSVIHRYAIPDKFIEHGTRSELLHEVGLDKEGLYAILEGIVSSKGK